MELIKIQDNPHPIEIMPTLSLISHGVETDIMFLNIDSICSHIDKYRRNYGKLRAILHFLNRHKKKLSLSHLEFIQEYLDDIL